MTNPEPKSKEAQQGIRDAKAGKPARPESISPELDRQGAYLEGYMSEKEKGDE